MRARTSPHVLVVGAGIGGLAAAIDLARRGARVTLVERAAAVGGKMRQVQLAGQHIDAGPTVLTLPEIFETLFADAGADFATSVRCSRASVLARHTWDGGATLDLHADVDDAANAIAAFAGTRDADGYRRFAEHAAKLYELTRDTFLLAPRPSRLELLARGPSAWRTLLRIDPLRSLARALGDFFVDPRLRQLFGRYATYSGGSPYQSRATLAVIAHVEQRGIYCVEGGMYRLAEALLALATRLGVQVLLQVDIEGLDVEAGRVRGAYTSRGAIRADAVVSNAEALQRAPALREPSLSAVTFCAYTQASGFPLARHTVFFSSDYEREFAELQRGVPSEPTIYCCAQDRDDLGRLQGSGAERLFFLVNARAGSGPVDESSLRRRVEARLAKLGLEVSLAGAVISTPAHFAELFPGSRGALYGAAPHGMSAFFDRPSSRGALPGLYLAGGWVHPGAGVPLAAQSGRLAAQAVAQDLRQAGFVVEAA